MRNPKSFNIAHIIAVNALLMIGNIIRVNKWFRLGIDCIKSSNHIV